MSVSPSQVSIRPGGIQIVDAAETSGNDTSTLSYDVSAQWSSSDTTIATVSPSPILTFVGRAIVTGVQEGTAIITASYYGMSATATVQVTALALHPEAQIPAGLA